MSDLYRRAHSWVALIFALPLLVVTLTGLLLAFIPLLNEYSLRPDAIAKGQIESLVERYDPGGRYQSMQMVPIDGVMILEGVGGQPSLLIDIASGATTTHLSRLSLFLGWAKEWHRRFFFHANWLSVACALAMVAQGVLGLAMGFTRLRNNLRGWHKAVAWALAPLAIGAPLLGALDGLNVRLTPAATHAAEPADKLSLIQTIRIVEAQADPAMIYSASVRGRVAMARVFEGGGIVWREVRGDGLRPYDGAWARILHEGSWAGLPATLINAVAATAILALLGSGVAIWATKRRRAWQRPSSRSALAK